MKKHLSLALALAMLLSTAALVACGEETTNTSGSSGSSKPAASNSTTAPTNTPDKPGVVTTENPGIPTPPSTPADGSETAYRAFEAIENLTAYLEAGHVNLITEPYVSLVFPHSIFKNFDYKEDEDPEQQLLGSESAYNLFDGDVATKWCCGSGDAEYCSAVVWEMDAPVHVTAYSFTTGNDNSQYVDRNLIWWRIYGTNELPEAIMSDTDPATGDTYFDSETVPEGWHLVDAVSALDESTGVNSLLPDENHVEVGIELPEAVTYKYYMLLIDWNESNCVQISELTLYGTEG